MKTERTRRIGADMTDIGIWYCTYFNDNWDTVGGTAYPPTMYRPLCSDRPGDFRAHRSDDVAVIDFHLRQIAEAGIDFLLFELSPLRFGVNEPEEHVFIRNARVVVRRIKAWNDGHARKIRYAIAAGAHAGVMDGLPIGFCMERAARSVYETFVQNTEYGGPDAYYHLNGKPLLVFWGRMEKNAAAWDVYDGEKACGKHFAIRYAQDVRAGSYGWNIYESGPVLHPEVEVVSPGWGHYTRSDPPYVERRAGDFYAKCWDAVLGNPLPAVVMIVAFNDYWENTAVWTADTSTLTDADQWIGKDGRPDPAMYWNMTKQKIRTLRSRGE